LLQGDANLLMIDLPAHGAQALELLAWTRGHTAPELPVLLLCQAGDLAGIAAGMAGGASDYLLKPLRRTELSIRVDVLLRRAYPAQRNVEVLQFGPYGFALQTAQLTRDEHVIEVTQKEFDLALLFFRHLGRPLSRAFILESVWAREPDVPSRTMDTHVSRVRSKLGLRPEHGYRLAPVYSYGYRLEHIGA
jgi:DNA-binding response OmpR family regulator